MAFWKRAGRAAASPVEKRRDPGRGRWAKCAGCAEILLEADVSANGGVCPRCDHHGRLPARARLALLIDEGSFVEIGGGIEPGDPLGFRDSKRYGARLRSARRASGLDEAVVTGMARIDGRQVAIGVMAIEFMGGTVGSVVGERLARMFEEAVAQRCPAVVSAASDGARLQEGVLALVQMAKTAAAVRRLKEARLPFLSILHDPTAGAAAAGFAMLADIILAEPGARVCFSEAGALSEEAGEGGAVRAEALLERGAIDAVVHRRELRDRVALLLALLRGGGARARPLLA
jgi:acetyl-CoA carboxylase carboxyl transferase subunit beta